MASRILSQPLASWALPFQRRYKSGDHRSVFLWSASHAARLVACHGVRSYPVPTARLLGECQSDWFHFRRSPAPTHSQAPTTLIVGPTVRGARQTAEPLRVIFQVRFRSSLSVSVGLKPSSRPNAFVASQSGKASGSSPEGLRRVSIPSGRRRSRPLSLRQIIESAATMPCHVSN